MRETEQFVLPLWAAVVVALCAGPILDAGFPDKGIWPLTFVGIGLILFAIRGRSVGGALLTGLVAGLSFYFTHIAWAALFLGPLPMTALSTLESLFVALGSAAIALAYRWVPRALPTVLARLTVLPATVAGLWTAREAWSAVWPYGGFAWGRVALSQSESPFASLFSLLGISGVSFVMVLVVALVLELLRLSDVARLTRATIAVGALAALLAIPAWPVSTSGSIDVLAVQGNGKAGYFDEREQGDLLQSQLDATLERLGENADVVVWPEGSADINPLEEPFAASAFDFVADSFDAPLISGVITSEGDDYFNSSLLWLPEEGASDVYNKRHPIPFGEYIPDRAFWRPFAPELIDLVQRQYTPGTTDGVMDIGKAMVGVNICFDIVDDDLLYETVRDGSEVIFAQSNNADFGRTDESEQQLAIARIRALELGRSVVNISTVGTSAIIAPDGSTISQLEWYTAGSMLEAVPLSNSVTPALVASRAIEWTVSGMSLLVLVMAGLGVRADRKSRLEPSSLKALNPPRGRV